MQINGSIENDGTLSGRLQKTEQGISGSLHNTEGLHGALSRGSKDYNDLTNLPKINSVIVQGNKALTEYGLRPVYYDSKQNWDEKRSLISEEGAIYIYTEEGRDPRMKIGDGLAYLIDLPFVVDEHISKSDREFWDNKVSAYLDIANPEQLVFSTDSYYLNGEILYYG